MDKGETDKKEKNQQQCLHCQQRGHITENCFSKQHGNSSMAAHTAAKASTEPLAASTRTTSINYYLMAASSNASLCDWFIDSGCKTHNSDIQSMFSTYTKYPPNTMKVNRFNAVILSTSGYGSVRLIVQLPD